MADTEFNDLIDAVQNSSAFDSLRAAKRLQELVESRRVHRDLREGNDLISPEALQKFVDQLRGRPGALDQLAELVEAARESK